MFREDCSSPSAVLDSIPIPRPPSLAERANRKHLRSLGGGLGGVGSAGSHPEVLFFEMLGVVRLRYVHLLISPCVKAACGWVLAISVS